MKFYALLPAFVLALAAYAAPDAPHLAVREQGSFTVGGRYVTAARTFKQENFLVPDGQRAYGDFAYVFYQTPVNAKRLPLVFQHGGAQSKRTWESMVDGREGFQNLFLRKGFCSTSRAAAKRIFPPGRPLPIRRGSAIRCITIKRFISSRASAILMQTAALLPTRSFLPAMLLIQAFQQSWSVGSGPLDNDLNADVLAQLADKAGGAVLVTHSMGGTIGWRVAMRSDKVKAIVAWEPGGTPFVFPENEMPETVQARFSSLSATAVGVPLEDFKKLTRIPIVLYYGDHIQLGSDNVGEDKWGTELAMARQFVAAVNRHGGDAELVHLPEIGITGNSHFLMGEKNNRQLADLMADWLKVKGLDQ